MSPRGLFVGLTTVDLVHRVDRVPGPDEKVTATRVDLAAGGPAAGAAVTFAALGGDAVLLSALGTGPVADLARGDLRAAGVQVVDAHLAGPDTPVSAVAVTEDTGTRSVVSRNAVAVEVEVPGTLAALVADTDVVLLDGHHPTLALAAARGARAAGVPTLLDAGSWKPVLPDLLPLLDVVIASAVFAPADGRTPRDLLDDGPSWVAVTHGGDPVRWWSARDGGEVAVPPTPVRDTLGAGDVFHGAAAYGIARGLTDPAQVLGLATTVARIRVGHTGPRSWVSDPAVRVAAQGALP